MVRWLFRTAGMNASSPIAPALATVACRGTAFLDTPPFGPPARIGQRSTTHRPWLKRCGSVRVNRQTAAAIPG